MKYLLLLLPAFVSQSLQAQKKKIFTIQPGENIKYTIPVAEQYEFPAFQNGTVFFKNTRRSTATLNYFFLSRELSFIDARGDTVVISNPQEVKRVEIGGKEFYYAPGCFVKKDTLIGDKMLATTTFFELLSTKRVGAYGTETDGGVDSFGSFFDSKNGTKIEITPQVVTRIAKRQSLFISDRFLNFTPVTKKNIYTLYAEKGNQLAAYLKTHEVNFFSRQNVVDLIVYMNRQ